MEKSVCIIGAGWAGLAAAVELSRHNIPVSVYESAPQIGGRARGVQTQGKQLDNGQHLLIGAYQQTLALLKTTGINEADVLYRYPQKLQLIDLQSHQKAFDLSLPRLPAPLHLLFGILNCRSLNSKEKISALLRFNALLKKPVNKDISVNKWLTQAGLPEKFIHHLLQPLCLAAMTTHPQQASAKSFQYVLQKTFFAPASHTDLLIPKVNLSQLFPLAAKACIENHGGEVLTSSPCRKLVYDNHQLRGIELDNQFVSAQQVILATPPWAAQKLLGDYPATQAIAEKLKQLEYEPVITVYLQYPENIALNQPMLGVLNATTQWLFDRRICWQPGLMAAVISARGEHEQWDNKTLGQHISRELASLFPHWPEAESIQVIREKRATLQCHVGVDGLRPGPDTPIPNLYLCGDYVLYENNRPSLPSTLEAAVESGVKCAQRIIQETP